MHPFQYVQATSLREAIAALNRSTDTTKPMAGGQDLLTELKERIAQPTTVVSLRGVRELRFIREGADGLHIGSMATLAEIEQHPQIRGSYAALAQAAASVGSPQIRSQATLGGNLCQRPRCWYYRAEEFHCLKKGGDRCFAVAGENKYHAIFSPGPCHIVHPSDCAPAAMALGAKARIVSATGERQVSLDDFFEMPNRNLFGENVLRPGELLAEVVIPKPKGTLRSTYAKFRERPSFDFAMCGAAVALDMDGDTCRSARIVLSGVAPVPLRVPDAETALSGKRITQEIASAAATAALKGAQPMTDNAYKVPLATTVVRRAILAAVQGTEAAL